MVALAAALLRVPNDHAAAQDAVQTVFCNVLRLPSRTILGIEDPAAWISAAVRNAVADGLRRDRRRLDLVRRAAERRDPLFVETTPTQPREELRHHLDRLDEESRELLLMRHVAGLTFEQIALALAENRNTVAARYRRAMESLRVRLEGTTGDQREGVGTDMARGVGWKEHALRPEPGQMKGASR